MSLKRWLGCAVLFVMVCLAADAFVTGVVIPRTPTLMQWRLHHLYHENGNEIPIIGASKVLDDYIPEEIGCHTFAYGMHAMSLDVVDTLLQIELQKSKTTPIIVDMLIHPATTLSHEDYYPPFVTDGRIRNLLKEYGQMRWRYYVPGLRYFGSYEYWLGAFASAKPGDAAWKWVPNFAEEELTPELFQERVRRRASEPYGYFADEQGNRKLEADIKNHPERLFFLVYSPYHSSCFAKFTNAAKFDAYKSGLSSLSNVVLIDWSRLGYPDDYFADTTHLNSVGATNFSRKLGERIRGELRARGKSETVVSR